MDARQAHAALSVTMNKTDANDARGLAHLLRAGLYREVRLKGWDDVRLRTLIHARRALLRAQIDIANALRGALRTFGLMLAAGPGNGGARAFDRRVREHLANRPDLMPIALPMLEAWQAVRTQGRPARSGDPRSGPGLPPLPPSDGGARGEPSARSRCRSGC